MCLDTYGGDITNTSMPNNVWPAGSARTIQGLCGVNVQHASATIGVIKGSGQWTLTQGQEIENLSRSDLRISGSQEVMQLYGLRSRDVKGSDMCGIHRVFRDLWSKCP